MKRVIFDFESRSWAPLKLTGAYKYSLHHTTCATCLCFKVVGEDQIYFLDFTAINRHWNEQPKELKDLWLRFIAEGYEFAAHNAFFETCMYKNVLVKRLGWPDIPFTSFRCTAAKAAACALPRNLEGAGAAMKLRTQKDKRGYNAMMATCKPTKAWNAWRKANDDLEAGKRLTERRLKVAMADEPPMFLEPEAAPDVWRTLYTYCRIDVKSEEALDQSLPDLMASEQELWFLNQKLNWRGLRIDIPTVKKIVDIMERESKKKLKELDTITMGLITKAGARKSILEFLEIEGIVLPDIRAKTVDDALAGDELNETTRRLLEIRKALSKTSTKKYQSFINRACEDNRVRDILLYCGASTGRDAGTGINPQNFPKGVIKVRKDKPYEAIQNVIKHDEKELRKIYGESLSMLFSSILRNMITASPGYELYVADFSKIEVAVLWWLAENIPGLEILNAGKDPYIYQAAMNLNKTYEEIEKAVSKGEAWAIDARQLGKAQILGCGFGMGWKRFQSSAYDQYRLKLVKKQSKFAVKSYREANAAVPALWKKYEQAAIRVVEERGRNQITIGKCTFTYRSNFLWIHLPSGRKLAYRDPQISWRVREYEVEERDPKTGKIREVKKYTEPQKTLEFWAVNSKTKKWNLERSWGAILAENITQAVARDLMMSAIIDLEEEGYKVLLTVHDEAVTEREKGKGSREEFTSIMCRRPSWVDESLPLDAKAWVGPRYRKAG